MKRLLVNLHFIERTLRPFTSLAARHAQLALPLRFPVSRLPTGPGPGIEGIIPSVLVVHRIPLRVCGVMVPHRRVSELLD